MSILLFHPQIHLEPKPKPTKKPSLSAIKPVVIVFFASLLMVVVLSHLQRSVTTNQSLYSTQPTRILATSKIPTQLAANNSSFRPHNTPPRAIDFLQPKHQTSIEVPILMYHHTPHDFEAQIQHLQAKGYSLITMRELGEYLLEPSTTLPAKPVVITFDDGFASAWEAFLILQKYQAKATLYVLPGGAKSNFCIGVERVNTSCGDGYLNWTNLQTMQASGLIEIGSHTVNHADLPSLSPEEQEFEIIQSKQRIEEVLGTPVVSFAFPYGRYSQATIDLVQKAGYNTAVTTQPGILQSTDSRFTLTRVRDAYLLP